jgi:hypothetical protein
MNCQTCKLNVLGGCREIISSSIESSSKTAARVAAYLEQNCLPKYFLALKSIKRLAESGRLNYARVYLSLESHWTEIEDSLPVELLNMDIYDELYLSAVDISPSNAEKIMNEVFATRWELIIRLGEILENHANSQTARGKGYLFLLRRFLDLRNRLAFGDMVILNSYEEEISDAYDDFSVKA